MFAFEHIFYGIFTLFAGSILYRNLRGLLRRQYPPYAQGMRRVDLLFFMIGDLPIFALILWMVWGAVPLHLLLRPYFFYYIAYCVFLIALRRLLVRRAFRCPHCGVPLTVRRDRNTKAHAPFPERCPHCAELLPLPESSPHDPTVY